MGYIEAPFDTQVVPLSAGLTGTAETISVMQRLALQGAASPSVREQAERIIIRRPARNWAAESRAIEAWVQNHIRYTRDGLQVETVKSPERMLREIHSQGLTLADCDDASVLISSLLLTVGHAPAFQVLGRGEVPHHVNVIDRTANVELDATGEPLGEFGFRRVYSVPPLQQ